LGPGLSVVSPEGAQFYLGGTLALVAGATRMIASTKIREHPIEIASKDLVAAIPRPVKDQEPRLSREAVETIHRYNTYLTRLDDLSASGAINEQIFLKLRSRYEEKIRKTIESGVVPSSKHLALSRRGAQAKDAEM
jgi:hypothetical protein